MRARQVNDDEPRQATVLGSGAEHLLAVVGDATVQAPGNGHFDVRHRAAQQRFCRDDLVGNSTERAPLEDIGELRGPVVYRVALLAQPDCATEVEQIRRLRHFSGRGRRGTSGHQLRQGERRVAGQRASPFEHDPAGERCGKPLSCGTTPASARVDGTDAFRKHQQHVRQARTCRLQGGKLHADRRGVRLLRRHKGQDGVGRAHFSGALSR